MSRTTYVILAAEADDPHVLSIIATSEATGPKAAVTAVEGAGEDCVAVPLRNWTRVLRVREDPRPPRVVTTVVEDQALTTIPHFEAPERGPQVHPGQTTIEGEIEAEELAAEIEGDSEPFGEVGAEIDAAVEARAQAAATKA